MDRQRNLPTSMRALLILFISIFCLSYGAHTTHTHVEGLVPLLGLSRSASLTIYLYAQEGDVDTSSPSGKKAGNNKQWKPPRFTQQVHKSTKFTIKQKKSSKSASMDDPQQLSSSSSSRTRSKQGSARQPWESGKSIDDLEAIMTQRWGTMSTQQGGKPGSGQQKKLSGRKPILASNTKARRSPRNTGDDDGSYIFNYDNSDGDEIWELDDDDDDDYRNGRKAVIDPWQKEDMKARDENKKIRRNQNRVDSKQMNDRDYYDHDDEGYEFKNGEDYDEYDKGSSRSSGRIGVAHVISPKPVGGRGTRSPPSGRQDYYAEDIGRGDGNGAGSGYFFNSNVNGSVDTKKDRNEGTGIKKKTQTTKKAPRSSVEAPVAEETSSSSTKIKPPKRVAPPPAKPLLNENGKPLLLTVDEATRQFQQFSSTQSDTIKESLDDDMYDDDDDILIDDIEDSSLLMNPEESPSMMTADATWSDLGITVPILLENLNEMGCPTPLNVQDKSCPPILTGRDVLVGTYTGSGKTLAFLVPLVQKLLWELEVESSGNDSPSGTMNTNNQGPSVLIVAPGRELASQITSVARSLLMDTDLTVQMAIGGTTFSRNLEQIRKQKPTILVGTPGRIAELIVGKPGEKSGKLKLGNLKSLVLDEFDALLEYKPHREPTRAVMEALKRRHGDALQSVLCSATATDIIDSSKVRDFLRPGYSQVMADPDDILVTNVESQGAGSTDATTARVSRTVMHGVVNVPHRRFALDTIRKILHTEPTMQQILIFAETPRKVDIVVEKLLDMGIIAAPLHGGMGSQKTDRAEVSRALRDGYVGIVVATELAARGLDAPLLTHVINLDLPTDASHYAHRAGRCGRGGRPGVVINITTSPQERNVPHRFARALGIEMHTVEPRAGQLVVVDPATQILT